MAEQSRRGPVRLMALPRRAPALRGAFEQQLRDEYVAVIRRRRAAGASRREAAGATLVGLALSGGGVRSATFSFGLMRGLAAQGLLSRIDLLSTVSGGGYIGGMLGRMACAVGIRETEAQLAAAPSAVLDWLRRNGRYLTPAGSRDIGIAIVTFARAALAIHGEVMFGCLPLALAIVLPHLLQHTFGVLDPAGWEPWGTLWWAVAALVGCLTLPGAMAAYWVARDGRDPTLKGARVSVGDALFMIGMVLLAGVAMLAIDTFRSGVGAAPFVAATFWSVAAGIGFSLLRLKRTHESRALAVARLRNQTTYALRALVTLAAGLFAVGLADLASWWLLLAVSSDRSWLWGGLGLGGVVAVLLRSLAGPLQQLVEQAAQRSKAWGPRLLHWAGLLAAASLVLGWLVVVQWLVFAPAPLAALQPWPAWLRWTLFAAIALVWWVLGAGHDSMPNASSLHSFYRARLTRAYLAVGNRDRGLVAATVPSGADVRNVTEVVKGDDIELLAYRPERRGGPLHLVNTCLNQTVDDASGLYNADRKGTLVTATARGVEIGARDFVPWVAASHADTLGKWIAISGAAAAPGAGSYTSRGWAMLLFLLGVRLGQWVRSPPGRSAALRGATAFAWARMVKPAMLWAEATATYVGRARPWWYLSDGGHFENTGVYALLKRECDFIVLAECGADGQYQFGDIENLVRKARIDLDAEIEFFPRSEASALFSLAGTDLTVLSPEELIDNTTQRGVLLARIRYRRSDSGAYEHHGTLLVIKPNLHAALDVDLLAYAQRHPAFPHETTGDQSFDEAQWESYHRLGEDVGHALHDTWLAQLPGWRTRRTHRLAAPARLRRPPADAGPLPAREPPWRRSMKATALGTTIGLGASGTLLLSLWQVQDSVQRSQTTQQSELRALFTEVARDLRDLDGSCPKVGDHTVLQVALLRELGDTSSLSSIEQQSIARLAERIEAECRTTTVTPSEACLTAYNRMQSGLCVVAGKRFAATEALSYWRPLRTPADDMLTWAQAWAVMRTTSVGQAIGGPVASGPASAPPQQGRPVGVATAPAAAPAAEPSASGAEPPGGRREPASAFAPCVVNDVPARLYLQVYDDASREPAIRLRSALLAAADGRLAVAPIENVARSAEMRQQRKPVPWAQPTLIIHDARLADCARAIAVPLQRAWPEHGKPWVTELPRGMKGQPYAIELWLPAVGPAPVARAK